MRIDTERQNVAAAEIQTGTLDTWGMCGATSWDKGGGYRGEGGRKMRTFQWCVAFTIDTTIITMIMAMARPMMILI